MSVYEITTEGGVYRVETEDPAATPTPMTAGETFAGGTQNLLNALTFGFGDEITAGGNAVLDALGGSSIGDAYNARLAQARDLSSRYAEEHPVSAFANNAIGFWAPVPKAVSGIFSTEKGVAPAIGNIVKAGAVGAGYGGIAGFGSGEGGLGPRLENAKSGGELGALFGGGLQTLAEGAQGAGKLYNAIRSIVPTNRAGKILNDAAGDAIKLADIQAPPEDPFFDTRTLAEELQSPNLAQLQDLVSKRYAPANDALVANDAARQALQGELFQALSSQPVKTAEGAGTDIRQLLENASKSAFDAAMAEGVPLASQNKTIPVSGLKDALNGIASEEYKAGGLPSSLGNVVKEINGATKAQGPSGPAFSTILDEFGNPFITEIPKTPSVKPFDYVQDLRERVGQSWVDLKNAGDTKGARVADMFRRSIDNAIETAPTSGGTFTADDVAKFLESKKLYSEASDIYKNGKVGGALGKMKEGDYFSKASNVVKNLFDGTPESTKQILQALPDDPKALDIARGAIRDYIRESTITNDEVFAPEKFRSFIRKYRDGLTAEVDGKRLFEPEHINAIEKIADDLALMSPRSQSSVPSMARRASKGQATTAQTLLMNKVGDYVSRVPFAKQAVDMWQEGVDDVLTTALLSDKSLAKELVKKATPSSLAWVQQNAPKLFAPFGGIAAQANGGVSGIEGGQSGKADSSEGTPGSPQQLSIEGQGQSGERSLSSRQQPSLLLEPNQYRDLGGPSQNTKLQAQQTLQKKISQDVVPLSYAGTYPTLPQNQQKSGNFIDRSLDRAEARLMGAEEEPKVPKITNVKRVSMDYVEPVVAAVIQQESAGNPKAVSGKGARGLMQLMPATAKDIAKELGIEDYDLEDPDVNILFGSYYLKKMLKEFDGDLELALTAYHSGPGRVKNLLKIHDATTLKEIRPYLGPVGRRYATDVITKLKKIGLVEV